MIAMHTEQCPYCRKWVTHKPILGTLHFCLWEAERASIDLAREQIKAQQRIVAQSGNGAPYGGAILGKLFGPELP